MSNLPPALLAKLQKRGIINKDPHEEVIAESYDDDTAARKKTNYAIGCPNKYNPYHQCNDFCHDRWREGVPESRLSRSYLRKRAHMLRKWPLPPGWKEVYDAGVQRHYYWNTATDDVCWLSPTHKRAVIGEAAPKVAAAMFERLRKAHIESVYLQHEREKRDASGSKLVKRQAATPARPSDDDTSDDDEAVAETKKAVIKRVRRGNVDPMDPAAYGECTIGGGWSAGLPGKGDAKTGADETAVGPLFQSRPYPAPGSILRGEKPKK